MRPEAGQMERTSCPPFSRRRAAPTKMAPKKARGPNTARRRRRTSLSAEGHRTRLDGQVSWLRILTAPRLPGRPGGIRGTAPRYSGGTAPALRCCKNLGSSEAFLQTAHRTSLLPPTAGAPVQHGMKFECSIGGVARLRQELIGTRGYSDASHTPAKIRRTPTACTGRSDSPRRNAAITTADTGSKYA